jgi:predicted kinase
MLVSGPAGSGKTTLAHAIASAVGCPDICRDEIQDGMVHVSQGHDASGFVAGPGEAGEAADHAEELAGEAEELAGEAEELAGEAEDLEDEAEGGRARRPLVSGETI